VPTRLTAEQRKMMEQLSRTLPVPDVHDKEKSFFGKVKDILG
jgi:hypothetical protein